MIMDDKTYISINKRLERLEKVVFGEGAQKENGINKQQFKGAVGGIRLLVSRGFFRTKKNLSDVRKELEKHGYHYSSQAIDIGLRRLSKVNGPIVVLKQGGKKVYGERK